ncbi:MAG TPA: CsbD family protein [Balneolaceae bacterium]
MSEINFKGNWNEIKEKLLKRYAILTEHDLQYEEGREEKVLTHLEEKLGKTRKEVKDIIRDLSK